MKLITEVLEIERILLLHLKKFRINLDNMNFVV